MDYTLWTGLWGTVDGSRAMQYTAQHSTPEASAFTAGFHSIPRIEEIPMNRRIALAFLCLLTLLAGCGEESSEPVAKLSVKPEVVNLPWGSSTVLHMDWEILASLEGSEGNPLVFVHLIDDEGQVQLTFDHPFPGAWQAEETLDHTLRIYHSALGVAVAEGRYRLTVGLYEGKERYTLEAGTEIDRREYAVATVEVKAPEGQPSLFFSESWSEPIPGSDRQVVAYRWLREDGALQVEGAASAGTLWLDLRLPQATTDRQLVLDEGASEPVLQVTSECGDFATSATGSGNHRLSVPLPAETACILRFEANFRLLDTKNLRDAVFLLEQVGWES